MYLLEMFTDLSWAGKINFLVIGVAMIWLTGWLITGKDELLIFLFLYCLCGVGGVFLMDPNNEIAKVYILMLNREILKEYQVCLWLIGPAKSYL